MLSVCTGKQTRRSDGLGDGSVSPLYLMLNVSIDEVEGQIEFDEVSTLSAVNLNGRRQQRLTIDLIVTVRISIVPLLTIFTTRINSRVTKFCIFAALLNGCRSRQLSIFFCFIKLRGLIPRYDMPTTFLVQWSNFGQMPFQSPPVTRTDDSVSKWT